jgi:hypothetical protein
VAQTREQFGLDPVRHFRFATRCVLSFQSDLKLTGALRHSGVENAVERLHTLFAISSPL